MRNCDTIIKHKENIDQYFVKDNNIFPNSSLPVLHYHAVLQVPLFFGANKIKKMFADNGWSNNWKAGVYTSHHYHSNTHEVIGVISGRTLLLLGGENGVIVNVKEGDVLVIPAGVAHKNLGAENSVVCVGGYPDGVDYDMNYGKPGERPGTDDNISKLPLPASGPICGKDDPLMTIWNQASSKNEELRLARTV